MLKRGFIVLLGMGIFLVSCRSNEASETSSEKVKITHYDSLPEGKWNGEYIEIVDEDRPEIKRKSLGSDFYNMGKAHIEIDGDSLDFRTFEKKRNVLSFTKTRIKAFIQNAFNERVVIQFNKKGIDTNFKGKYKGAMNNDGNQTFTLTVFKNVDGKEVEYQLQSGSAELIDFQPRLGNFEFTVKGRLISEEGTELPIEVDINIRFEEAIMMVD